MVSWDPGATKPPSHRALIRNAPTREVWGVRASDGAWVLCGVIHIGFATEFIALVRDHSTVDHAGVYAMGSDPNIDWPEVAA